MIEQTGPKPVQIENGAYWQQFRLTMGLWQRFMAPKWEYPLYYASDVSEPQYRIMYKMNQEAASVANDRISKYLADGASIVFINDKSYQVLYPAENVFFTIDSSQVHSLGAQGELSVPALFGQLSARILIDRPTRKAFFIVGCNGMSTSFPIKRTADENPELCAVFANEKNKLPRGILIFGKQRPNKMIRLRKAA